MPGSPDILPGIEAAIRARRRVVNLGDDESSRRRAIAQRSALQPILEPVYKDAIALVVAGGSIKTTLPGISNEGGPLVREGLIGDASVGRDYVIEAPMPGLPDTSVQIKGDNLQFPTRRDPMPVAGDLIINTVTRIPHENGTSSPRTVTLYELHKMWPHSQIAPHQNGLATEMAASNIEEVQSLLGIVQTHVDNLPKPVQIPTRSNWW